MRTAAYPYNQYAMRLSAWASSTEAMAASNPARTVDVHVGWLRQKLGEKDTPRHLLTMRGYGYKFVPDP